MPGKGRGVGDHHLWVEVAEWDREGVKRVFIAVLGDEGLPDRVLRVLDVLDGLFAEDNLFGRAKGRKGVCEWEKEREKRQSSKPDRMP